ncbi:hypothetical protein KXR38_005439 [Escherichia coli]|uniref:Uracil-DNA glycosylase-like domain-containing protein n=15 Tax=Gammaproteobacteria TaxID=1236 RepID=A0A3L4Y5D7_ECOLX|nr:MULTISPECIES: hypothetical protein [Enterobacteriaceae]EAB9189480.1 hypothetical protein [Salmonella enterica subsp. enterica serovar Heidelberg]EAQ8394690.1 hypothetical protein [Salmonella enterica subsp. enterica serovar Worthington]EBH8082868.1 hypothetical protein [Salmonella bongori]EBN0761956.1 hypothetical protein [Salmonella enterica subsp. enterica serovar Senftenberg]EBS5632815.1 hypothetical protein [Salmonella enterica subsp. enterica serovar Reading]EBV6286918.1 hypothetical 
MSGFIPFVGSKYENSIYGLKLLVLGLSHYGDADDNYPDFTKDVIAENAYTTGNRFFTILTNVLRLSRESITDDQRKITWENIAFYNYIQQIVGEKGRISPTKEMWDSAREPFLSVIKQLQPNVILVLGTELWDHLPEVDGVEWCWIRHPSSSNFSYDQAFNNLKKSIGMENIVYLP